MSGAAKPRIDLSTVPAEIRERLQEWLDLAEAEGVEAVEAKLDEHSSRLESAFVREAAAVERLLGS